MLPHFQGALHLCCSPTHLCSPKYLLFQLNLKIINVQENHKKLVSSVIISYILDGAVCSGAFENSLICNNYVNHSNSGSRLTDTPWKATIYNIADSSFGPECIYICLCAIKLVECGNLRFRIKADKPNSTSTLCWTALDPDAWIVYRFCKILCHLRWI